MPVPGPYTLQSSAQDSRGVNYFLSYQNGKITYASGESNGTVITWSPKSAGSNDGSFAFGANNYLGRQSDGDAGTGSTATNFSLVSAGMEGDGTAYLIQAQWSNSSGTQTAYLSIPDNSNPGDLLDFLDYTGTPSSAPKKKKWIFKPSQPQPHR